MLRTAYNNDVLFIYIISSCYKEMIKPGQSTQKEHNFTKPKSIQKYYVVLLGPADNRG